MVNGFLCVPFSSCLLAHAQMLTFWPFLLTSKFKTSSYRYKTPNQKKHAECRYRIEFFTFSILRAKQKGKMRQRIRPIAFFKNINFSNNHSRKLATLPQHLSPSPEIGD
jgi:hypothetical protein